MKRLALIIAAAAVLAATADARPGAPPPSKRRPAAPPVKLTALTVKDSGRTITPRVGQRITVRLAGNPTTGYSWSVASITGSAVRQAGKISYKASPAPRRMVGSGGFSVATFKAVRNGRAVLTMEYKRPWEKKKPIRTFTVTIDVGGGKALSPKAARLAKLFKDNVTRFSLDVRYFGPQDKPYYQLTLRVPILKDRRSAFWPAAQLLPTAARKVIDHLAADGFFDRARDITLASVAMPKGPAYVLLVSGPGGQQFYEPIGWDLKMLARLDALAKVLDGDAAKKMALLLGRLSGFRRQWLKDAERPTKVKPPLRSRKGRLLDAPTL